MTLDELKQIAENLPNDPNAYVNQKAAAFLAAVNDFRQYAAVVGLTLHVTPDEATVTVEAPEVDMKPETDASAPAPESI